MPSPYLHGFDSSEQQRLIQQAEYWRTKLIRPGLEYRAGQRVLDVGCGVGAVLRVLAAEFPGIMLAGIDLEPRQVEFARSYLSSEGLDADLRIGDGAHLPWPDGAIDHVYMMWFIEHLRDGLPVLREARRVLRPGGTAAIAETDYTHFKVYPLSDDWDLVEAAQYEHFRRHGNPIAGRRLGTMLAQAGFGCVTSTGIVFHFSTATDPVALRAHTDYVAGFLEPALPALAALGFDLSRLRRGLAHWRTLPDHPEGAVSHVAYKAIAVKT